ncbi:unnamed protein product [Effrenium voratum]|nr:unnamed protein product [Effrenium voratum]
MQDPKEVPAAPAGCCGPCCGGCCAVLALVALLEFILACTVGLALNMALSPLLLVLAGISSVFFLKPTHRRSPPRACRIALAVLVAPLALFCVAFLGIHVWTLVGRPWASFPESCSKPACCRASLQEPFKYEEAPLLINATSSQVLEEIQRWVEGKINWPEDCTWLGAVDGYARASCSTSTWKFLDDMVWRLSERSCAGATGVLVEVHSESRAGYGDGGLNMYRVIFSVNHLKTTFGHLAQPLPC